MLETPPLSLYIHFPWCVKKCPYCDFNSHGLRDEPIPQPQYIDALLADLALDIKHLEPRPLQSIFMGGGTPSLIEGQHITRLLNGIANQFEFADKFEVTLEANPGTVDSDHFATYRDAGINRLSIGVQSFNPTHLKTLGRIHSAEEAVTAVDIARACGFDNFNLDLMFGLPQQTAQNALDDLQQAIELNPTHLSWYQLTLEPNTAFHQTPPALPDDESIWAMQEAGQNLLDANGFDQYEVSAYARGDNQARHNLNYWCFGDYLGIGAGAHSKLTSADDHTVKRAWKTRHPKAYLEAAATPNRIHGSRILNRNELIPEFAMNAFRLKHGVDVDLFQQRTGLPLSELLETIESAGYRDLIESGQDRLKTSPLGWTHLNTLLEALV